MRRRSSLILVSSLAALTAAVAIAALAAVPPNLTKAIEAQRRLTVERPQDPAVFNDFGNLLMLVPQAPEAEAAYRKAIELDPNKASALFNLGLLLQQRGELREAYDLYQRAVKADPNHAWAHYQLGTIEEVRGQRSKAVDSYARAFALDPQLAFPEVNPHIVDNKLVTQAMLRAYKNDFADNPQVPKMYDDAARIAALLVPKPAPPVDETAAAPSPQRQPASRQPVAGRGTTAAPSAPGAGSTVLREGDLDRRNPTGQAGAARGLRPAPGVQGQQRGLREWSRPEPTVQEVPGGDDEDGDQPQVITPSPGGVYYRPGIQSTGRLNLRIAPDSTARR